MRMRTEQARATKKHWREMRARMDSLIARHIVACEASYLAIALDADARAVYNMEIRESQQMLLKAASEWRDLVDVDKNDE